MDYKGIADKFEHYKERAMTEWLLGYPSLIERLTPMEGKKGLDFGCGSGLVCRYFRDHGAQMTGVDISPDMIEEAQQVDSEGISYHRVDQQPISFLSSESHDFAVSIYVLCEIQENHDVLRIMLEINRLLKPGGRFLILNANWDKSNGRDFLSYRLEYHPDLSPGCRVKAILKSTPPITILDHFRPQKEYSDLLRTAGFVVHDIYEPILQEDNPFALDEKNHPPLYIIHAEKDW